MSVSNNKLIHSSWDLLYGSFLTLGGVLTTKDLIHKGISGYAVKEMEPIDQAMMSGAALILYFVSGLLLAYKGYEEGMRRSLTSIAVSVISTLTVTLAAKRGNRFTASIIAAYAAVLSAGFFVFGAVYLFDGIKGIQNYFFSAKEKNF